ncbi:Ubiquitin fusion degradation protein 4 [Rhizina undulata]
MPPPRRVTRSSARQSSDQAGNPENNIPHSGTSPSTATNAAPPTPASRTLRKRKTSSTSLGEAPELSPNTHTRKRAKSSAAQQPQQEQVTTPPKSRKKGKSTRSGGTEMSGQGTPGEPSNSNTHVPSSVSKRKSARSKKLTSTPAVTETTATSSTRNSPRKMESEPNDLDVHMSDANEKAELQEHSEDEDQDEDMLDQDERDDDEHDRDEDDYEHDEDEDDVFEGSYMTAPGSGGLSHTLRALSGMMSGISHRLRDILVNLRQKDDQTAQMVALQDLAEILLVSTEDNLSGHFSPDLFIKELVSLLSGPEPYAVENPELMLLACRCIANLMEALPAATANVVYGGAVPVLCAKLMEIQYIDLAEQALSTLEKISVEYPTSIVREGGLTACLNYLDFFATNVQRTAVTTAANCCRNIPDDSFTTVKDVMPILLNVLASSDQKVVEQGCLCVARIVESFRHYPDKLEKLMSIDMLKSILQLLLPGTTNLVGPHIHTQFLRVLAITAKASPVLCVDMFKMNVVDTLYQILTGVSPPVGHDGAAMKNDSVMTMQALIHRPREQVFETLNVICELLPRYPEEDAYNELSDMSESSRRQRQMSDEDKEEEDEEEEAAEERRQLLGGCKDELKRFAVILLPTLTDAYSSTVNLNVRQKVLIAQLRMIYNLNVNILKDALSTVPFASHLAAILSQQDHPSLVAYALQASELLHQRLPEIYDYHFHREGVIAEISKLAAKEETSEFHDASEHDDRKSDVSHDSEEHLSSSPVSSRSSSSSRHIPTGLSPEFNNWIPRKAKNFMEVHEKDDIGTMKEKAIGILDELKGIAAGIQTSKKPEAYFERLAQYFDSDTSLESISSFELLNSHTVEALVSALSNGSEPDKADIRRAFVEVFMRSSGKGPSSSEGDTPFSVLVHKLQDLLSRSEHFEVVTVHHNTFDSNRSSAASMLAKQIRLKLVADDDSEIPRHYRNIMVSIHAIATFKALDDYLRPRIKMMERPANLRRDHSSGLSSTLAAFAAAAGLPHPGAIPRLPSHGEAASSSSAAKPSRSSRRNRAKRNVNSNAGPSSAPQENVPKNKDAGHESHDSGQEQLECMDERHLPDDEELDDMDTVLDDLESHMGDEPDPEPNAVNMEIATSGKVTARKEDGTRVATPSRPPPGPSQPSHPPANRPSPYTSSSKSSSSPSSRDWHIEFSIGDHILTNDMTIYRAVQLGRDNADDQSYRNVWSAVHPIKFRKVPGLAPSEGFFISTPEHSQSPGVIPASLDKNKVSSSVLQLLSILHSLNANLDDVFSGDKEVNRVITPQPLSQFVNTKLTAKLNRQLEEPLIVASSALPSWSEDLARIYPFLFPFETRHLFLQSTSFGYSRSMTRWQNAQSTGDARQDRHRDENRPFLGRLQRQKVRISRTRILESALKVMELYGASPSLLEVEYFEEVGTGLGPTLEFYSSVSREFASKKLKLWRENDMQNNTEYAYTAQGLFPTPMDDAMAESENGKKVLHLFKMLGKFVARSMLDSRIIDISFNPTFFRTGENGHDTVPLSLGAVRTVDRDLASSMKLLRKFALAKKAIDENSVLTPLGKAQRIKEITFDGVAVEDLELDFTLPGYPELQLIPNGDNTQVTIHNVGEYVDRVIDLTLGSGVKRQAEAFRVGFSQVFPYSALKAFTPDELVMLFGRVEEDWSLETLMDSIKADHGFNMDSKSVRNLLQAMSEYNVQERREFLQFVTGSPKLPIGGFKSLTPLFTVVCKPSEPPYTSDDYLPSVMTCVNYLKLPDYSSLEVLKQRLQVAIKEGQGAFHLS